MDPQCGLHHHTERRLLGLDDILSTLAAEHAQIERDAEKACVLATPGAPQRHRLA